MTLATLNSLSPSPIRPPEAVARESVPPLAAPRSSAPPSVSALHTVRSFAQLSLEIHSGRILGGSGAGAATAAGICAIAYSASAVIVSAGFTPGFAGIAAPSHTNNLW